MQILYLLVLGDKSNVLYGKDLCFNANYRFKHEIINEDEVKVSWEIKDILPDNFFTTRENNKNCCIDNVSEIVGINGSGKTLIFKTLYMFAIGVFTKKIILIYKMNDKLISRCGFNNNEVNERVVYEIDCSEKNNFVFSDKIQNRIDNNRYELVLETDFVYLCNHYCPSWETLNIILDHDAFFNGNYFDYSTAGLIFTDTSFYYKVHDFTGQPVTALISHRIKEMERILNLLNFIQKIRELNISKINVNDYKKSISNIIIKKVCINWNNEILSRAYDVAQQLMLNVRHYDSDLSKKTLSNICSIFLDGPMPYWTYDFFFLTFLCFIASHIVEYLYIIQNNKRYIPNKKINEYLTLANQFIENKLYNNINNYYIILDKIREYECKDGAESDYVYLFFSELLEEINKQKESRYLLEFDFADKKSRENLIKILELYFKMPKSYPFIDFNFQPSLSSGELSFLTLWARLYAYLENNPKSKHAIIFIDEAETTLHPEWQKALCQSTISFIEDYCKFKNRKLHLHIIFASHSPMLMSDVPTGNVVFLDKDNSSDNLNNADWKTFAGDIFEIYQKGFFLKNGSIGNFALSKVDGVIKHISQGNISDDDRKIIDMIGDGLITNYFHRIIDNQSSSQNDSQK